MGMSTMPASKALEVTELKPEQLGQTGHPVRLLIAPVSTAQDAQEVRPLAKALIVPTCYVKQAA